MPFDVPGEVGSLCKRLVANLANVSLDASVDRLVRHHVTSLRKCLCRIVCVSARVCERVSVVCVSTRDCVCAK